jgi:cyclic pyranopterin phosphate synthase
VTVSLDSLDDDVFRAMNGVYFSVDRVLAGIDVAARIGLTPMKINVVVKRGENEHSILPMARYFRGTGHILRFIEYMDVGHSNGWRLDDVVSAAEIVAAIHAEIPIEPIDPNYRGEVAGRWRYRDGSSRARLSADGQLFTCLFATRGHDLRSLLRGRTSVGDIADAISRVWLARSDLCLARRPSAPSISRWWR